MKIFAYNLCIEFDVVNPSKNFDFPRIGFNDLMGRLFKGMDFESQVFYVSPEPGEDFVRYIFDLQANEIWRNLDVHIVLLFSSEGERDRFVDAFTGKFQEVDAAGGLVVNENDQFLLIYTRGKWTLPKGGVEWRESPEDAAIREVTEETGISDVRILAPIGETLHTFIRNRRWILKTTYWYKMKGVSADELVPQSEENIEAVKWMSREDWMKEGVNSTYPLIRDLFEGEFSRMLSESRS
jgi:ADP-ribose pyrophosphatase YjhB (NUDIX family)